MTYGDHRHPGLARVAFANKRHRRCSPASVIYIAASVPLHVYCSYVIWDVSVLTWFPMWFSYLLLIVVYRRS